MTDCACNLLGIVNGAKNPYGAAEFANIMTRIESEMEIIPLGEAEAENYLSEQDKEVLYHVRDHAKIDSLGWGEWTGEKWFYPVVVNGENISTVLDSYESVLRDEIDRTLSYKMPEVKPFKMPETLTFEDGSEGYLTSAGMTGGSGSVSGDANAVVAGEKSMVIDFTKTEAAALRSDPEKLEIPIYRSYRVSFDWKFLEVSKECEEWGMDIYVTARPANSLDSDLYQIGYISVIGVAGDSGTAVGELNLNTSSEDICLVFCNGITGTGKLAIDNIQITEIVS
ncbi:MAG: hypothetical protein IJY82_04985 [Oscillospiraceae bacterium]|nr:hypothetical protein [Oscillospiraceae bacterium]